MGVENRCASVIFITYNLKGISYTVVKRMCQWHERWEDIVMFKIVFVALLTLSTLTVASAAIACPDGYVPCGETSQLCCPI